MAALPVNSDRTLGALSVALLSVARNAAARLIGVLSRLENLKA
jgi:hypothetical protein